MARRAVSMAGRFREQTGGRGEAAIPAAAPGCRVEWADPLGPRAVIRAEAACQAGLVEEAPQAEALRRSAAAPAVPQDLVPPARRRRQAARRLGEAALRAAWAALEALAAQEYWAAQEVLAPLRAVRASDNPTGAACPDLIACFRALAAWYWKTA